MCIRDRVYTAGFGQTTDGIYGIGDGGRILEYVASGEDEWGEKEEVVRLCADDSVLYQVTEKRNLANRNAANQNAANKNAANQNPVNYRSQGYRPVSYTHLDVYKRQYELYL